MPTVQTEHPHIVRDPHILGGEPIVGGQRVAVRHVVIAYLQGETIKDVMTSFDLTEAPVHDALSYYYDHKPEIEHDIARNRLRTVMREGFSCMSRGKDCSRAKHLKPFRKATVRSSTPGKPCPLTGNA